MCIHPQLLIGGRHGVRGNSSRRHIKSKTKHTERNREIDIVTENRQRQRQGQRQRQRERQRQRQSQPSHVHVYTQHTQRTHTTASDSHSTRLPSSASRSPPRNRNAGAALSPFTVTRPSCEHVQLSWGWACTRRAYAHKHTARTLYTRDRHQTRGPLHRAKERWQNLPLSQAHIPCTYTHNLHGLVRLAPR